MSDAGLSQPVGRKVLLMHEESACRAAAHPAAAMMRGGAAAGVLGKMPIEVQIPQNRRLCGS